MLIWKAFYNNFVQIKRLPLKLLLRKLRLSGKFAMEKTAKIRVILDTNILVSWLINPVLADLDNWFYSEKIELAFSAELLQEFVDVTNRPKLRKYFKSRNADDILMLIREHIVFVDVKSIVEACRDTKDNFYWHLLQMPMQITC